MSTKAPNPVDKYVGSRVRMRRIMLGMSQEKLGEALGLTFQQVQKYEKGTNRVGASRLQQISEILQVPVSFLFDGGPSGSGWSSRKEVMRGRGGSESRQMDPGRCGEAPGGSTCAGVAPNDGSTVVRGAAAVWFRERSGWGSVRAEGVREGL